jgi:hypothetical protein
MNPKYDEIARRYPHLIKAMQNVAILCKSEAIYCIRDLKAGSDYSGEAVNHFGGTREVLRVAWNCRHLAYMQYNRPDCI